MTFVRSDLPFKKRKDLECEEVETICYELSMAKRKWVIIGAYRQPFMTNQNCCEGFPDYGKHNKMTLLNAIFQFNIENTMSWFL